MKKAQEAGAETAVLQKEMEEQKAQREAENAEQLKQKMEEAIKYRQQQAENDRINR